jgi:hypothetical protein
MVTLQLAGSGPDPSLPIVFLITPTADFWPPVEVAS